MGKSLGIALMYRGDVVIRTINAAVATAKANHRLVNFVDWSMTYKCGMTDWQCFVVPGGELAQV